MRKTLIGTVVGALIGLAIFSSIAAATPGQWTTLECSVIGFWLGAGFGSFLGVVANV